MLTLPCRTVPLSFLFHSGGLQLQDVEPAHHPKLSEPQSVSPPLYCASSKATGTGRSHLLQLPAGREQSRGSGQASAAGDTVFPELLLALVKHGLLDLPGACEFEWTRGGGSARGPGLLTSTPEGYSHQGSLRHAGPGDNAAQWSPRTL